MRKDGHARFCESETEVREGVGGMKCIGHVFDGLPSEMTLEIEGHEFFMYSAPPRGSCVIAVSPRDGRALAVDPSGFEWRSWAPFPNVTTQQCWVATGGVLDVPSIENERNFAMKGQE